MRFQTRMTAYMFTQSREHGIPALPLLTNAAAKDPPAQRAKALRGLHRFMNQKGFLDAALTNFAQLTPKDRANKDLGSAWEDFTRDGKLGGHLPQIAKLTEANDPAARGLGWAALVNLATGKLTAAEPRAAAQKRIDMAWTKPEAVVPLLHAIGQTRADQYAFQLRGLLKNDNPAVQKAALETWKLLGLDREGTGGKRLVLKGQPYDQVLAEAQKPGGDAKLGSLLFLKQGCIACHTVAPTEPLKGPYLGDIAARSKRPELIESLLKPSAKIAQGFETIFFVLNDGKIVEGFIVRESGDEVELRTNAGISLTLAKKNIDERGRRPISVMPEGIIENLTAPELSALLAYMESLNTKT